MPLPPIHAAVAKLSTRCNKCSRACLTTLMHRAGLLTLARYAVSYAARMCKALQTIALCLMRPFRLSVSVSMLWSMLDWVWRDA